MTPIDASFVREHAGFVRALARSLVTDPEADDLAQETWLSALAHPPREATNLPGWLGTALGRLAGKSRRGSARRARRETAAIHLTVASPPLRFDPDAGCVHAGENGYVERFAGTFTIEVVER